MVNADDYNGIYQQPKGVWLRHGVDSHILFQIHIIELFRHLRVHEATADQARNNSSKEKFNLLYWWNAYFLYYR